MKKKILGIFICMLMTIPVFSLTTAADPITELEISIAGSLPLPIYFNNMRGVIGNIGDEVAYNINYTIDIQGGFNGGINYTITGDTNAIPPHEGKRILIRNFDRGVGPVMVTMTASAMNAETVTTTVKGFQIRCFTWIPFSWLSLLSKEYYP